MWKKGHYAKECPTRKDFIHTKVGDKDEDEDDYQDDEATSGHIFQQSKFSHLSRDWLLLHNQSTLDQIVNKEYLTDIHTVDKLIIVFCNAESTTTNKQGKFGKFTVWYILEGIANVIMLKIMTEHYRVTYDSGIGGGAFTVHTKKERET